MAERLLLVCGALLALVELAAGKGNYQSTKDGKTLVWNSDPKPGDVSTWSGDRDANDYARGFGQLIWYTSEPGFDKPQLYARYWGRMLNGKLEGPVNVHSKKKTHHAIFIDGRRITRWASGTAPLTANAQWRMLAAKRRESVKPSPGEELSRGEPAFASELRRSEPEAPAAGPVEEMSAVRGRTPENRGLRTETESIQDIYAERWQKIDIDESLRLLAFPPRTLRVR